MTERMKPTATNPTPLMEQGDTAQECKHSGQILELSHDEVLLYFCWECGQPVPVGVQGQEERK